MSGEALHSPNWVQIDPTGGDPWMGGPVLITICSICGAQSGTGAHR